VLTRLQLTNYRNLNQLDLTLSPTANLVVAPNGSGKSNLLESIYYLTTLRLFRPYSSLHELIGPLQQFAQIHAELTDGTALTATISHVDKLTRQLKLNGKVTNGTKFAYRLPSILFAPHSVDLISEDPSNRRNDLDDFICIIEPNLADTYSQYEQVLKHRNALLKYLQDHPQAISQLAFWDQRLLDLAKIIITKRLDCITRIATQLLEISETLFPSSILYVEYCSKLTEIITSEDEIKQTGVTSQSSFTAIEYMQILQDKIAQNQQKEINAGQSLYGPHRDDIALYLNQQNLRYLGSRGQQRLGVFAWKLAQLQLVQQQADKSPVLLLDDIFSELDRQKREFVVNTVVKQNTQFILTGVEITEVPVGLQELANQIQLPTAV
jgi:DNA replication and repair protein RecF